MANGTSKFATVHRSGHVNIRKYHPDVAAALEYPYCFVGVGIFNDLEACILNHFDSAYTD